MRRSVVAAHHMLVTAIGARHAHRGAVAHAVMRRVSVTEAGMLGIAIAVMHAPGTEVPMRAVAVDRGAFEAGAIIVMGGGIGVATAIVAVVIRAVAIGAPAGYRGILIGRIRREGAGAGTGRALVDVVVLVLHRSGIILLHRIGQPLIGPTA